MPTSIGNIAIHVADLERSERFYVDVLGLEVTARIDTPDVREVIVCSPGTGSQLMLAMPTAPDAPVRAEGGLWKIFVETDDAPTLYDRAVAAGAEAVEPPKHLERFKVTIALVRDPDGHLLELGQLHPR